MNPYDTSPANSWCKIQLYRDNTPIGNPIQLETSALNENQGYCIQVIDTPTIGTYTYYLRVIGMVVGGKLQFGEAAGPVISAVEL